MNNGRGRDLYTKEGIPQSKSDMGSHIQGLPWGTSVGSGGVCAIAYG